MKNLLFLISFVALFIGINPTIVSGQYAHSIKINSNQSKDSLFVFLTDTVDSKYRHGKGKFYNAEQSFAQRTFDGCRTYEAVLTQATTAAPSAVVLKNTLVGAPALSRDSIGHYKLTKTAAFTSGKTICQFTIGNATGFTPKAYRLNDSVVQVVILSTAGIGADLGGTGNLNISVYK